GSATHAGDSCSVFPYSSDYRSYLIHDVTKLISCLKSEIDPFQCKLATQSDVCHLANLGALVCIQGCMSIVFRELGADATLEHFLVALLEPVGHVLALVFVADVLVH